MNNEFSLIDRYFRDPWQGYGSDAVALGIGDDCALINVAEGRQLVCSTDTMVEGRHFPSSIRPPDLAWRMLAAATSDLAAMGAEPLGFTLSLTLPKADNNWLEGFSQGLLNASRAFALPLVGGDTTKGHLSIGATVLGQIPKGKALRRAGAQAGDDIWVSGPLGAARAALDMLGSGETMPPALCNAYFQPRPRLVLGCELRELANSAIDISDGLLADLQHILDASELSAELALEAIPVCETVKQRYKGDMALSYALNGGDDYELCFTAAKSARETLESLQCSRIGSLTSGEAVIRDAGGQRLLPAGYQHFR